MTPPDSPSPRTLDFAAIRTDLVLSWGHLPDCGEGAEFPWDCTCGYQGRIERMESVIARAEAAQEAPAPEGLREALVAAEHAAGVDSVSPCRHEFAATVLPECEWRADAVLASLARTGFRLAPPSPAEPPRPDPSDCPKCGEWRDSPTSDCAACGFTPAPCGDPLGACVYTGPHSGPHKVAPGHPVLRAEARPPEGLNAAYETRLYVTADEIEAALKRLHGPVTRDEATIMAAAQAAADALRGGRIVAARLSARGAEPR